MKLLFDQNLSPKLVSRLSDLFPDSDHVFFLGMDTQPDEEIRRFAAKEQFTLVTKDADFGELYSLFGGPPKVIWIRRGNCSTNSVERILLDHFADILRLEEDSPGILTLY
jgi:predicted nuclease of predicted toxin-antitoxin system